VEFCELRLYGVLRSFLSLFSFFTTSEACVFEWVHKSSNLRAYGTLAPPIPRPLDGVADDVVDSIGGDEEDPVCAENFPSQNPNS
jgi:hypothetical protein